MAGRRRKRAQGPSAAESLPSIVQPDDTPVENLDPKYYTVSHVRRLARSLTKEAIDKLAELMRHSKDEKVQFAAAVKILDRAWGYPSQDVKVTESAALGDDAIPQDRKEAFEALAKNPKYLLTVVQILQRTQVVEMDERPNVAPLDAVEVEVKKVEEDGSQSEDPVS
jgi:hypothetical protein